MKYFIAAFVLLILIVRDHRIREMETRLDRIESQIQIMEGQDHDEDTGLAIPPQKAPEHPDWIVR